MTTGPCVKSELAMLPVKVRRPFEALLAAGQIDESVLELVLRAGRRAGDVSKLVGFAVGYLYMQNQGVPVADVIRMSEHFRRRINLSWSARRWRDEHSRLSRAETLNRLAAKNEMYDVSKYEAHLPWRWPGYLIRSSRRLGMEGLRQRHCVASYHNMLLANSHPIPAGRCAIAVVFFDKQRWTVQLFLNKETDHPLRLGQIRTRDNAYASQAVSESIHELLGIEFVRPSDITATNAYERFYRHNLQRVLPVLRELGTERVCVSFDGSGDSGSIWDIGFTPELAGAEPLVSIRTSTREFDNDTRSWRRIAGDEDKPLQEAISELTYDYLEETNVDWYNNDGGYGELTIDVAAGTVAIDVNQRFTESTCQYSAELDIASGEEL